MSSVATWLLSIAGVCILSVLVDVILPNGQTNKFIKGIFAFCMILVIISPIPSLINKDFKFNDIIIAEDITIDKEFIYQANRDKLSLIKAQIESELTELGINGVNISVNGDIFSDNMKIENIFVDLSEMVINENVQHTNIEKTVKQAVRKFVSLQEEQIIINGWQKIISKLKIISKT